MAVQFYMRAYNTVTKLYVDWVVNDTPDSTGVYAPGGNANLTNIVVNRAVQSKINNFLKPVIEPSYITNVSYNNPQDGYLFHLNSYDWLNPVVTTGPISIPSLNQPIGISVVRGSASVGEPFTPSNYASLYWEEGLSEWSFAFINSNGSIGAALPVSTGILQVDGYLSVTDIATDPVALTGLIRLPDNQFIKARNSTNGGDATLIGLDNFTAVSPPFGVLNRVQVGDSNYSVRIPLYLQVDGYIYSGSYASDSQSGFIRNPATSAIITSKGTGADVTILSTTANLITLGDTVNTGIVYNTSTGSVHNFEINSVSEMQVTGTQITVSVPTVTFSSGVSSPVISQTTIVAATGQPLTLQAQNATTTGGLLNLTSGTGATAGNVNVQTGGVTRFTFTPTTALQLTPTFAFGGSADAVNVANPRIQQDALTSTGTGTTLTVQAQNATAATSTGGNLALTSGTGTTLAGSVLIETGGVPQVTVTPVGVTISGNLTVLGTTTTIDSIIVDIEGRVIHGNFVTDSGVAIPPIVSTGNITGFTIHRGSTSGLTSGDRDSAGLIYTELNDLYIDGYWKHATVLKDVDTNLAVSAFGSTIPTMAAAFVATPNAQQETVPATIPGIGGFRALNATPAVSATTLPLTTTVAAGSNTVNVNTFNGAGVLNVASNVGFPTAGTLHVIVTATPYASYGAINSVQTITYTGVSGTTQFTGCTSVGAPGALGSSPASATLSTNNAVGYSQNLFLVGTDTTNHIVLGETPTPQNAGFRVYTTTGSFTDFFVNNTSEVQIASDANGPFVRESATTFVPAVSGFLRVPNASIAAAARNQANTQDLVMLSTDAANHIIMGDGTPFNAGFIFNTTTASLFDYQTASVSEVQLGSDANGPFVRESATTFIPAVSGFVRVPNATTAVAARNAGNTTDILLVGTDNLNHILFGDTFSPTNAGMVFSTTTSSVFDFWVNGQSQVQILQDNIVFTNTDGYATISQAPTYLNNVTGAPFTVAAQSTFGTNGIGGNLVLSSGFGSLIDGYVDLQVSGITVAAVEPNKFTFVQGQRRHITRITGTYNVSLTDDFIAITTLTSSFTIFLPTFPASGDAYEVKDATGNAGTFPVTVSGNGVNIDGSSTFSLAQPYAAATFTYNGTTWSIT